MATKSKKTVENLEKTLNKSSLVDNAEQLELLIERVKKAPPPRSPTGPLRFIFT